MNELLNAAATPLCLWLEAKLPRFGLVEGKRHKSTYLSATTTCGEGHISTLSDLDLAALLRVLDQNWHELGAAVPLPREARN